MKNLCHKLLTKLKLLICYILHFVDRLDFLTINFFNLTFWNILIKLKLISYRSLSSSLSIWSWAAICLSCKRIFSSSAEMHFSIANLVLYNSSNFASNFWIATLTKTRFFISYFWMRIFKQSLACLIFLFSSTLSTSSCLWRMDFLSACLDRVDS